MHYGERLATVSIRVINHKFPRDCSLAEATCDLLPHTKPSDHLITSNAYPNTHTHTVCVWTELRVSHSRGMGAANIPWQKKAPKVHFLR